MTNVKDIELGLEINELEKKLLRKNIALIGLSSSIIGYSPKAHNYLNEIVRSIKFRPKNFTVFNAHFQNLGREEHIADLIDSNISLLDAKKINREEIDKKIIKLRNSMRLPMDGKLTPVIKACYGIKDQTIYTDDKLTFLKDSIINNEEVHIFYSSDISIDKEDIDLDLEQRKRNFDKILSLNPDASIYTIGLIVPNGSENGDIEEINQNFQKIASTFGAIYIDPIELTKYLKKDIDTYYLSDEGSAILSLKCIEAMYNNIVVNDRRKNFQPTQHNLSLIENSLDYLFERSLQKSKELEELIKRENQKERKKSLLERLESEHSQQQIYQKIKKKELI